MPVPHRARRRRSCASKELGAGPASIAAEGAAPDAGTDAARIARACEALPARPGRDPPRVVIPAREALERLEEGNARFASGRDRAPRSSAERRAELARAQEPFAIVLGCSDSRVPAEIVFDQGLGDLFVIRVAGNIVAPSLVGSVEFAATAFGTRLVVVLGHSGCGAVLATLEELGRPGESQSPNLRAIVDRIRPAVEDLLASGPQDAAGLLARAVRANVEASVDRLRHGSEVLERLIEEEGLAVVGAEYSLESGRVRFLTPPKGI